MILSNPAMILAAGQGTRLRPLTSGIPKALVPVGGKPMVDHILDPIFAAGCPQVVLNTHYKGDQLAAYMAPQIAAGLVCLSPEPDVLLETGGGVKAARQYLGTGPRLVINGDVIWRDADGGLGAATLRALAAAFDPATMDVLLLVTDPARVVDSDRRGNIQLTAPPLSSIRMRDEDVELTHAFCGIQIVNTALYDDTPEGPFSNRLIWRKARAKGRLFGLLHKGLWCHVGTVASHRLTEEALSVKADYAHGAAP